MAEVFSLVLATVHRLSLRIAGALCRSPEEGDRALPLFHRWCAQAESQLSSTPTPLRSAVAVQTAAALLTARHLAA